MAKWMKRLTWIVVPQLILVTVLILYLFLGALIFRYLDPSMEAQCMYDVILFEFATLTTIGYGNVSPISNASRLFCIVYSIFGIPLILLTLANFGKWFTRIYWYTLASLKVPDAQSKFTKDANMPIFVIFSLYLMTYLLGSHTVLHTGPENTFDDIYFGFISFTTVGFGDELPVTDNFHKLWVTVLYLTWGIMLTTQLFTVLNDSFRKVHYLGRRFTGARDVPVWMGGQKITVSHLLEIVANEFEAPPHAIREMLTDLDNLIPSTVSHPKYQEPSAPLVKDIEDFDYYD